MSSLLVTLARTCVSGCDASLTPEHLDQKRNEGGKNEHNTQLPSEASSMGRRGAQESIGAILMNTATGSLFSFGRYKEAVT